MKVLVIDLESSNELSVYEKESDIEAELLEAVHDETAIAIRFSDRAGGIYERMTVNMIEEDDQGNTLDEPEFEIYQWLPV